MNDMILPDGFIFYGISVGYLMKVNLFAYHIFTAADIYSYYDNF
jgi:hypothetical protein